MTSRGSKIDSIDTLIDQPLDVGQALCRRCDVTWSVAVGCDCWFCGLLTTDVVVRQLLTEDDVADHRLAVFTSST